MEDGSMVRGDVVLEGAAELSFVTFMRRKHLWRTLKVKTVSLCPHRAVVSLLHEQKSHAAVV